MKERETTRDYVEQRDGGYYVTGTRIALDSIVLALKEGESPETILQSFPLAGSLVRVYGAIIFYLGNQDKVESYLIDQERLWAEVKMRKPGCRKLYRRGCARPGNTRGPPQA